MFRRPAPAHQKRLAWPCEWFRNAYRWVWGFVRRVICAGVERRLTRALRLCFLEPLFSSARNCSPRTGYIPFPLGPGKAFGSEHSNVPAAPIRAKSADPLDVVSRDVGHGSKVGTLSRLGYA